MKNKIGVSVSMDMDLAQELRAEVEKAGENFSSYVCSLIRAGRTLNRGIFETTSDDAPAITRRRSQAKGSRRDATEQEQGTVRPQTTPARPESKSDLPEEDGEDSRRSLPELDPSHVDQGADLGDLPDLDPNASIEERVYSCVGLDPRSTTDIAMHVGLAEVEVGEVLERLIESGEPILLRRSSGKWVCWIEANGRKS